MPKMRLPKGAKTPSVADFAVGGPLTTIGPGSVPLDQMQVYFRKMLNKVLPEIQESGGKLSEIVDSVRPTVSRLRNPSGRELPSVNIDQDPLGYAGVLYHSNPKAPLAEVAGRGSDASLLEMVIDDLTKYFSGPRFDPFK